MSWELATQGQGIPGATYLTAKQVVALRRNFRHDVVAVAGGSGWISPSRHHQSSSVFFCCLCWTPSTLVRRRGKRGSREMRGPPDDTGPSRTHCAEADKVDLATKSRSSEE